MLEMVERTRGRIIAIETGQRSHPERAMRVLFDGRHGVATET